MRPGEVVREDVSVPESEWVWCGYAGHLIAAQNCRFHLCTRVGDFRISTVGDYHPAGSPPNGPAEEIGLHRFYETYVFCVVGDGEGEVADWSEVDSEAYQTAEEADAGHMAVCRKYAAHIVEATL